MESTDSVIVSEQLYAGMKKEIEFIFINGGYFDSKANNFK